MNRVDIAIVGGGLAAAAAAESYRQAGGAGDVTIFTQEPDLPVHRPPLSKEYLRGDEALENVYVHPAQFYQDNAISLRLNRCLCRGGHRELSRSDRRTHSSGALG